jgi:hypothetical protein
MELLLLVAVVAVLVEPIRYGLTLEEMVLMDLY